MRPKQKRGVSTGTIVMLVLTAAVLAGFLLLMPTFSGGGNIRTDAAKLAVAIDRSISQIAESAEASRAKPGNTAIPSGTQTVYSSQSVNDPAPTATPVPKLHFSLCAAGSISWNANIRKALTLDGESTYDIFTDEVMGLLNADLSIATLENTLAESVKLSDLNQSAEMLEPLYNAGINTLGTGFPSALNSGLGVLAETQNAIRSVGMLPFGLYTSAEEKAQGVLTEAGGVTVGILHYQDELSSTGKKKATADERAMAMAPIELESIAADIAALKARGAQVVIVSLCWGKAGAAKPTDEQVTLAQGIADAGADVILGTRSGVVQTVRVLSANRGDGAYHPVVCAYSLGALFSSDRSSRSQLAGMILKADVVVEPAAGRVAFESLTYTPTFSWSGKENKRSLFRILPNTGEPYPEYVTKDQKKTMEQCQKLITTVMEETGISMAQ